MSTNAADACRSACAACEAAHAEELAERERRLEDLEDMATGVRASEYHAQWWSDMVTAAVAQLVDRGFFANEREAESALEAEAEALRRARAAKREAVPA